MTANDLNRRQALGLTAGLGLGLAAAPAAAAAAAKPKPKSTRRRVTHKDVVVVGGGFAGLTAAYEVAKAGRSVVVLEAADQVGGRVRNRAFGGGHVQELGAQFVGPTQNLVIALADELGVKRYDAAVPGQAVYSADGNATRYDGDTPPDRDLVDLAQLVLRLDQMASTVPLDAPQNAPDAGYWDTLSVESFIRSGGFVDPQRTVDIVSLFFNSAYGSRPRELSLLFVLAQIAGFGDERTPGTLERGISGPGGAQEQRIVGGTQRIALELRARLGARRVLTSSPVRRIETVGSTTTVVSDTRTFTASRVIVATPPQTAAQIAFSPVLSPYHHAARQRLPMGRLRKCFAVYDEPFWRKDGLSGMALKLGGTVKEQFDNSVPGDSRGVLMAFMGGEAWSRQASNSPEARKAAVLADLADTHGPQALKPIDYFEQDWVAEPWIRGAPVATMAPGVLTEFGTRFVAPVGPIHWAGTETATYWNGYMDGAVRSGQRAAKEALAEL